MRGEGGEGGGSNSIHVEAVLSFNNGVEWGGGGGTPMEVKSSFEGESGEHGSRHSPLMEAKLSFLFGVSGGGGGGGGTLLRTLSSEYWVEGIGVGGEEDPGGGVGGEGV